MRVMVIGGVPDEETAEGSGGAPDEKAPKGPHAVRTRLDGLSMEFGAALARRGHELIACSPQAGTFDCGAVRGALAAELNTRIHLHFPSGRALEEEWARLTRGARNVRRFSHPAPTSESGTYTAWLFAQMRALEDAEVVVGLGGKQERTAHLILLMAESRGRLVVPSPLLGGAAERSFSRQYHALRDALGEEGLEKLEHGSEGGSGFLELVERAAVRRLQGERKTPRGNTPRTFFISYPREHHATADAIEVALRRRGHVVYRDEDAFPPSAPIPSSIRDWIYRADVFVALWSMEYACSPWCHDEMETALDRADEGRMQVWLLRLDDTRVVPPRARSIPHFDVRGRPQAVAVVESLLAREAPALAAG